MTSCFFVTWHVLYDNYLWFAIPDSCRLCLLSEFRGYIQATLYNQYCNIKDNKQMHFMDCTVNWTLVIWSKMSSHGANSWVLINCIIISPHPHSYPFISVHVVYAYWDINGNETLRGPSRGQNMAYRAHDMENSHHTVVFGFQDTTTSLTFRHKQWIPFLLERAGELMAFQTVLQTPYWGSGMNSLQ